jgi:hypothetical protein
VRPEIKTILQLSFNVTQMFTLFLYFCLLTHQKIFHPVLVKIEDIVFWDMTLCSPLCSNQCSSETSVATQRTTQRHIPEDDTLHNHRCENLKSCLVKIVFTFTQLQISCASCGFQLSLWLDYGHYADEL